MLVVLVVLVVVCASLSLLVGVVFLLTKPRVGTVASLLLLRFRVSSMSLEGVIETPIVIDDVIETSVVIETPVVIEGMIRERGVKTKVDGVRGRRKLEGGRRVTNGGSWGATSGRVVTGRTRLRSGRLRWRVVGDCRRRSDGGGGGMLRGCGV